MKKVFILFCFVVLFTSFNTSSIISSDIDWSKITMSPCSIGDTIPWDGPFEFRFCTDTLSTYIAGLHKLNEEMCDSCCFSWIYYERWIDDWDRKKYEVSVVGMFFEPLDRLRCKGCMSKMGVWDGYSIFLESRSYNPDFAQKFGTSNVKIPVFYPATCQVDEVFCDTIQRCCIDTTYVKFLPNGRIETITNGNQYHDLIPVDCPADCEEYCGSVTIGVHPQQYNVLCNMDTCETTEWICNNKLTMPFYQEMCFKCTLDIYYSYRTTTNCQPELKDYRIDYIELSNECIDCYNDSVDIFDWEQYYYFAKNKLMKYKALENLEKGKCDSNYRIINSPCWKMDGNPRVIMHSLCNNDSVCCEERFAACRVNDDIIISSINRYPPYLINCDTLNECYGLCGEYIYKTNTKKIKNKQISNNNFSYIKPNPTNSNTTLCFNSDDVGKFRLLIFNSNGDKVSEYYINKNKKYFEINLDLSNLSSGLYIYRILSNSNEYFNGTFVVIK